MNSNTIGRKVLITGITGRAAEKLGWRASVTGPKVAELMAKAEIE